MTELDKIATLNLTERSVAVGVPLGQEGIRFFSGCFLREPSQKANENYDMWNGQFEHCSNHGYYEYADYAYWRSIHFGKLAQDIANKKSNVLNLKGELGPREFTLTYSKSWFENDADAQHAMEVAIDRLTRYYKDEIIEFHAVGEYTKAGCSHVHGYYLLDGGRKITDKNFKRSWKYWNPRKKLGKGFEGGHHETVKRISDFAGYTEKHLEEAWLDIHITNNANDDSPQERSGDPTQLS